MSKLDWHSLCSLLISLLCCTTLELPLLHVHGFSRQSVQHRSRLEVFLRHVKAAFSHVLSQLSWEGEECQVASGAKKEHCREAKRPALQMAFWPVVSAQTSLFKAHRSYWVSFFFSFFFTLRVGLIPTQTSAPNAHTSPPIYFIWAADADDKLILRTNSIITNNPRCWQAHKKSLDEWVVYLLQCTQCWAQARPAKMPLHYEAAEQECSTACPCDQGLAHRKLDISSCIPQQQSSGRKCLDGLFSSLKCHL